MKKLLSTIGILATTFATSSFADSSAASEWQKIEQQADGQTVYFHAWGGSQEINRYIQWAGKELKSRYNVTLNHVKVTDISETTTRLIAEKAAGKNSGGSVDMVWINGENFKSMKDNQLLFGPFVEGLPSWQYVDKSLPIDVDFSEPTEGLEAPWGVGQLVFIHDEQTLHNPPRSFAEMLSYAKAFPNRLTYPRPPEFHGTSFIKALLIELTNNDPALQKPVTGETFEQITQPLWAYLDEFHKVAWRGGKQFPGGTAETLQLLDDGQIDLAITFNPNAVFSAQSSGNLADSTKAYAMDAGALSNIHFLAIPWNANASAGAQVAINFLLSPEAQSRKGNLNIWGDPSVLSSQYLTGSAKNTQQFKSIAEPHPSWQSALEKEWLKRYGN
ncbi:ABC transporter substrate-binding protein [Vibrio parahaemolyticus]|uniref:ABC transporter substrate-binding protein n=1 Tax=Vibrio parahaemolyticus TaxID=670 RepID=UPI001D1699D8|nr:ABC transporter substrate-binding protein [Vibrio parahaemolyticus]EGR0620870.1 ABC transporter substrate-binding protein [Vibrio parahaemolyticus]EII2402832.1 ABC transporter substrate-binding protein [Vibrio parahaemolyticus]EII2405943.1 ABC transporter substrate-binding protein [Vibrio parahaemolyticus]EII3294342.1 ABC transporter substrate-binding protein [Vibrio parahaemolyticus]EJG1858460.1 ABC transporter substrate-binding protein [Vibrio parahaemolyticus]